LIAHVQSDPALAASDGYEHPRLSHPVRGIVLYGPRVSFEDRPDLQYIGAHAAQAPHLRVTLADGALVAIRDQANANEVPSLLAASNVLGPRMVRRRCGGCEAGETVAVVGDGAVVLSRNASARAVLRRCADTYSISSS
jgi:hypothetical protein